MSNAYDAIVVGSGISGGIAAKELAQKGLKTLILERGRKVEHVTDYPTAGLQPWELENGDQVSAEERLAYQKQMRTGYTIKNSTKHWFVKDTQHPYQEKKRFDWMRGYHEGGKSIMWGRQCYRFSDLDFEANAKEGIGIDWPIRYKDIAPWYSYVEKFVGISGQKEGLAQLPDGEFLPPMNLNVVEEHVRDRMKKNFKDRILTIGRVAMLTQPHNGRGSCQYRNKCIRGCPYGAYYSSNSGALPVAYATGNCTLRPYSIVHSLIYDRQKNKVVGVNVIDAETKQSYRYFAPIIFLNAGAVNSTAILMNSKSNQFPNGIGNNYDVLGRYLMDHHFLVGAQGWFPQFDDQYVYGRRGNGIYIPRFRNVKKNDQDFLRGYGYQGGAGRAAWWRGGPSFGKTLKDHLSKPETWNMNLMAFGECLPYRSNRMTLDTNKTDEWGLPTVTFDAEFKENERKMQKDMIASAVEILEAAGAKSVRPNTTGSYPGLGIHEMGSARMGKDPKTSVLNKWNQVHDAKNVFVTDGACMTSSACVNPSITYMALTARAVDHAVNSLKKGELS